MEPFSLLSACKVSTLLLLYFEVVLFFKGERGLIGLPGNPGKTGPPGMAGLPGVVSTFDNVF